MSSQLKRGSDEATAKHHHKYHWSIPSQVLRMSQFFDLAHMYIFSTMSSNRDCMSSIDSHWYGKESRYVCREARCLSYAEVSMISPGESTTENSSSSMISYPPLEKSLKDLGTCIPICDSISITSVIPLKLDKTEDRGDPSASAGAGRSGFAER